MALKLNLGCGLDVRAGFVNVDKILFDGVDVWHDLNHIEWPFLVDSVELIIAYDVIEHLKINMVQFMNEAHRILRAGGEIDIRVPSPEHPMVWADPTHIRPYTLETFDYFNRGSEWQKKYQYTNKLWKIKKATRLPDRNLIAQLIKL